MAPRLSNGVVHTTACASLRGDVASLFRDDLRRPREPHLVSEHGPDLSTNLRRVHADTVTARLVLNSRMLSVWM